VAVNTICPTLEDAFVKLTGLHAAALLGALTAFGVSRIDWCLLLLALLLAASAFSALGALVSVAVREVFEAQTLANCIRFPMMFLGGVFVPVEALPPGLQIVARLLPLTYAVEGIRSALAGTPFRAGMADLAVLAGFTAVLFALAVRMLARQFD
jgi:ABC-2 type transport system permease protein